MITSKKISIVALFAMLLALLTITALYIGVDINGISSEEPSYATKIFGSDIISVEIIADENDWQNMLDNALSEEYIMADVIVNGTKFTNVGVRPKGNSSLTQVAQSESSRYSFRLQFDEYIKGQTCFGLTSFVVNNMLGDNSYMKEYVSYDLMKEIGVDAPYFGFADIKVNGDSWGLYLAVEMYNDSYEQRVYKELSGELYNVKSMDMGDNRDNFANSTVNNFTMPSGRGMESQPQNVQGGFPSNEIPPADINENQKKTEVTEDNAMPPEIRNESSVQNNRSNMNFEGMGGGRGGNTGGSLAYIDDNLSSYSSIFNNVVGKGNESSYKRVIEALKALSEDRDIEKYFDVDKILRYFAAHTIVVNLDSYSSSMAQNYYIYENDGQITILPWDYNLAWGGFQNTSASSVINFPIDTPVSGVSMEDRPLLQKLFANEEYLERYHSYLQELIDNYFADGKFEEKINALNELIKNYVSNDKTAFCSYEEYESAVSSFITLGNLRAESVQGQLNGTVPSTTSEQNKNADKLISSGNLSISTLGSMMGGRGNQNNAQAGIPGQSEEKPGQENSNTFPTFGGQNVIDIQLMQEAFEILSEAGGEVTDEVKEKLYEIGLNDEQIQYLLSRDNMPQDDNRSFMQGNRNRGQNTNFVSPEVNSKSLPNYSYIIITSGFTVLLLLTALILLRTKQKY